MIKLPNVNSRYGAPMGRSNVAPANWQADPEPRSLRLVKVPLDAGGYDAGGAYWGLGGKPLYCLATRAGEPLAFVRAGTRLTAAMALGVPQYALARRIPAERVEAAFTLWSTGRHPRAWDEYDLETWFNAK